MKEMISYIESILDPNLKNASKTLEEKKVAKMSIPIDSRSVTYLSYTFDVDDNENYPKGMFPFFQNIKGAKSICDYVIFASYNSDLYVLLIELKKGKISTSNQLMAGENFARFIVKTCNRVFGSQIEPKVRKITVRDKNIIRKGTTKMQEVVYDRENSTIFEGSTFYLKQYLK